MRKAPRRIILAVGQILSDYMVNPYLSFVIASRNDGHGGNMEQRLQVSLDSMFSQLEKYRIESELLFIDWNPPQDRPPLRDIVRWPQRLKYCTIRNIIVPPRLHQQYKYSDRIKLGVGAMNSGIRRARGEFILPRTSDLIYSDELMKHIAQKNLNKEERYRVNRCDVDRKVLDCKTLQEQLDFCRDHIIHVNEQSFPKGWQRFLPENRLPALHTNACGDFQLMAREKWHLVRGYREPKDELLSAYADSLLSFASYAAGVREVVLKNPMCIYHIDHDSKFNDTIVKSTLPMENIIAPGVLPDSVRRFIRGAYRTILSFAGYRFKATTNGIPSLHFSEYRRLAREMVTGKRPYIFNDEDWGLGTSHLEEYIINTGEWDKEYGKY